MTTDYTIRPATLADLDVLVHHRLAMFSEMGTVVDAAAVEAAFRQWATRMLAGGEYRAWLAESADDDAVAASGARPRASRVVAGGGMTVIPWPPGPWYVGGRIAFVYNVYTEPAHRRRGLAGKVMEAIHACCRAEGIGLAGLNASTQAHPLYTAMGYQAAASPMMLCAIG